MASQYFFKVIKFLSSLRVRFLRRTLKPTELRREAILRDYLKIQELRRMEEERFQQYWRRGHIL